MLAEQCGENIEYVCHDGQQEGSVILHFLVPEECAKCFGSSQELQAWCLEFGISEICIDGENKVLLPHAEKGGCYKCKF